MAKTAKEYERIRNENLPHVLRMRREGFSYHTIAAHLQLPRTTVLHWMQRLEQTGEEVLESEFGRSPLGEFSTATNAWLDLQTKIAIEEIKKEKEFGGRTIHIDPAEEKPQTEMPSAPTLSITYQPDAIDTVVLGKRVFESLCQRSQDYLNSIASKPRDFFEVSIETDRPILLCNLSDLHIGTEGTDHARILSDVRLLANTMGAFALFGGDGIDNFIKITAAMTSATSSPGQQWAALEYVLSEAGGSILGGICGNHEAWTMGHAGIDYLRDLMARRNIVYTPRRLRLLLHVNKAQYRIELRHSFGFKSSINLSNQFQRMYERSDWQWDIGMLGHTHDGPFYVPFERHGRTRWGALAGSYKIHDDYGAALGYNPAIADTPSFLLYPDRHHIVAHKTIEDGIAHLNSR